MFLVKKSLYIILDTKIKKLIKEINKLDKIMKILYHIKILKNFLNQFIRIDFLTKIQIKRGILFSKMNP